MLQGSVGKFLEYQSFKGGLGWLLRLPHPKAFPTIFPMNNTSSHSIRSSHPKRSQEALRSSISPLPWVWCRLKAPKKKWDEKLSFVGVGDRISRGFFWGCKKNIPRMELKLGFEDWMVGICFGLTYVWQVQLQYDVYSINISTLGYVWLCDVQSWSFNFSSTGPI